MLRAMSYPSSFPIHSLLGVIGEQQMNLGLRIKHLREKFGWTQDQFADKLNMTPSDIGEYESGRNVLPSTVLAAIADLFDTSTDYLLGRADEPYNYPLLAASISKEDGELLRQFKARTESMFRQNVGNISEDQIRSVMRYMEFTFLEDMEEYKSKNE